MKARTAHRNDEPKFWKPTSHRKIFGSPTQAADFSGKTPRARLDFVCRYCRIMGQLRRRCGMRGHPIFLVIRFAVPALYFGGLFFYFLHVGGSVEGAEEIGLGPTLLGLAIVGLLFSIPLIVAIIRMILGGPRSPGSGGRGGPSGPDDGDSGFDADAVVARYLAQQSAQAAASSPTPSPQSPTRGGVARKPTGFGRKNR
jgi:hypothetical protein